MPAGRPRSEAARHAILEATREELTANGYDRLTIDRVARTAGVSRQTLYRWYASKNALVADCLLEGLVVSPAVELVRSDDVRADVVGWMLGFAALAHDPQALALIRAASAAAAEDPAISEGFQQQIKTQARNALTARLSEAETAGELKRHLPAAVVAEIIVGSLIYRLLADGEITPEFVTTVASTIFEGIDLKRSTP